MEPRYVMTQLLVCSFIACIAKKEIIARRFLLMLHNLAHDSTHMCIPSFILYSSPLQLEDLYVEILYTILHMIGCDADQQRKMELFKHLQSAFFMENEKHQQLLDIASMREVVLLVSQK